MEVHERAGVGEREMRRVKHDELNSRLGLFAKTCTQKVRVLYASTPNLQWHLSAPNPISRSSAINHAISSRARSRAKLLYKELERSYSMLLSN
jgi:hypothetical protein